MPPAGPATGSRGRETPERPSVAPTPTGPAKGVSAGVPEKSASATSVALSETDLAEKARQDARALRFRALESNTPTAPAGRTAPPAVTSTAPPTANTPARDRKTDAPMGPPAVRRDEGRNTPVTRSPRRPSSPAGPGSSSRTRRSGSIESRTSDRSRNRPSRDDLDRDKVRAERNTAGPDTAQVSRNNTPSREGASETTDDGRKKQEDLLQARHDKLAAETKGGDRRSSGSRRETEQERSERKAKEKAEDREKEKEPRDDAGGKRKRDEAVSFQMGVKWENVWQVECS